MEETLDLHVTQSPLAVGGGWIGERASLEPLLEAVAITKARASGGLDQGRGSWVGEDGQRIGLFGGKSAGLLECLEVMVKGGAAIAGDPEVPGLGDRVNDSAEIGWLGEDSDQRNPPAPFSKPCAHSHGAGSVEKCVAPCLALGQASFWFWLSKCRREGQLPFPHLSAVQICLGR